MKITKCKACGENIFFVKTKNDKLMPVNADIEISDGKKILWQDEITGFKRLAEGQKGYSSHFGTCPSANNFRKSKKKGDK